MLVVLPEDWNFMAADQASAASAASVKRLKPRRSEGCLEKYSPYGYQHVSYAQDIWFALQSPVLTGMERDYEAC